MSAGTYVAPDISDSALYEFEQGFAVSLRHALSLASATLDAFDLVRETRIALENTRRELSRAGMPPHTPRPMPLAAQAAADTAEAYELRQLLDRWRRSGRLGDL